MIESALGWIGELAHFLGSLFPRLVIVKSSHRCLKYVHGKRLVLLEPGIWAYWPLVTELEWCSVVRQVLVHQPHLMETRDGHPVVVAGVTAYTVSDPIKYLSENEDPYSVADDVAAAAIRQVVAGEDLDVLRQGLEETDARLTAASRRLLRPFGVRVEYTRLTDLGRTRPVHLSGLPAHLPHVQ